MTSYAQVNGLTRVGSTTYSFSCPTIKVTGGTSLACYDAYRTITGTAIHSADATMGIDGSWRPTLRVQESRIKGSKQEKSNWCGPSAAQAALHILGVERTQATLSIVVKTDLLGLTTPANMASGMNSYLTGSANQYSVYQYGIDGTTYRARKSVDAARPVMVLVRPGDLPGGSAAWYYRHWITLHGWAGQIDGADAVTIDQFVFFDPGSGREFAGISTSQLRTAAQGTVQPGDLAFSPGSPGPTRPATAQGPSAHALRPR